MGKEWSVKGQGHLIGSYFLEQLAGGLQLLCRRSNSTGVFTRKQEEFQLANVLKHPLNERCKCIKLIDYNLK